MLYHKYEQVTLIDTLKKLHSHIYFGFYKIALVLLVHVTFILYNMLYLVNPQKPRKVFLDTTKVEIEYRKNRCKKVERVLFNRN